MSFAQKIGEMALQKDMNQGAKEFAAIARYVALGKGSWFAAAKLAEESNAPTRIRGAIDNALQTKAAVLPGTSTGWGAQLGAYSQLADSFLLNLRQVSAFDALLPFTKSVPLGFQQIAVATGGASGAVIGEAMVKPIAKVSYSTSQLSVLKTVAIVIITSELLKLANDRIFQAELAGAVAAATDAEFCSQITSGLSPIASSGSTQANVLTDLNAALTAISFGAGSQVFLLVTSGIAKYWSTLTGGSGPVFPNMGVNGGTIGGMTVVVTSGLTQSFVAVDATQIGTMSGALELDGSDQSAVQMESAPDSPPTATTNFVSLWQNNLTALKAVRFWSAKRLRTAAVSLVNAVSYG
jgi:hypothetical protein